MNWLRTIAGLAAIAMALSACGVRSNLDYPPQDKAAETTAQADSGQGKAEGAAPKPHRGFILDGLIR